MTCQVETEENCESIKQDGETKIRVKTTVGPLMDDNDVLVRDDKEMGELLNTFSASVFTKECQDNLPATKNFFHGSDSERIRTFIISSEMVKL